MRFAVIATLVTAAALTACGGHRGETTADMTMLHACEVRQLQFGSVAATVMANADANLSEVDLSGGSQSEHNAALHDVYRAFGQPHIDTNVHQIQSKWGLSAWVDRCGRAGVPHVAAPTHGALPTRAR